MIFRRSTGPGSIAASRMAAVPRACGMAAVPRACGMAAVQRACADPYDTPLTQVPEYQR